MEKISILFLTRYTRQGASSRYRFFQYFPYLEEDGFSCIVCPLFDDDYLKNLYSSGHGTIKDYCKAFFRRISVFLRVKKYNLLVIEKELLPYIPAVMERLLACFGIPYIVDYDDAIFDQYRYHKNRLLRHALKKKIDVVMRSAAIVLAGNKYLADYAYSIKARRVEILPTVIDLSRYSVNYKPAGAVFRICWIGTPVTKHYLEEIGPVLKNICANQDVRLVVIGANKVDLAGVPLEIRPWSEEKEVSEVSGCDVGIMPLANTPWEKGKCGLKLIQYMACGLPVVASRVGVNVEIVEDRESGFLVNSSQDWVRALTALRDDKTLREKMGKRGREIVEHKYSLEVVLPLLRELILSSAKAV